MKKYLVQNKADDYGNCRYELIETTAKNAKEYYHSIEIPEEDAKVLAKYLPYIEYAEEKERTDDARFYGVDE